MNRTYVTIMIICFIFWASSIWAQESMYLEEAIHIAVYNNPSIKALNEGVYGKEMDKRTSFAQMLPKVTLNYGYARLKEDQTLDLGQDLYLPVVNETNPPFYNNPDDTNIVSDENGLPIYAYIPGQEIPIADKDQYKLSLEIVQPLFAGGALKNSYKVAKNDVLSAELDKQQSIRELKLKVIEAYYGVTETRQFQEVAQSGVLSIKAQKDIAQAFFNEGMIPKNDLLVAQVGYADGMQKLIAAKNAVKLSESAFNLLLARNLSVPVIIDAEIPMPPLTINLEEATATALKHRQELKILKLQMDSAQKGVKIAKSVYLPGIAATYTYERTGDEPDVEDDTWTAGVGLNWNIFEGTSHYWNVAKARSVNNQLSYLMQSQQERITLEVKSAYLSAHEAMERTNVAIKSIDQAQENLRIEKDRFNLQVSTSADVLDAQALLDKAQTNYISARADYAKAIATLEAAMGIL